MKIWPMIGLRFNTRKTVAIKLHRKLEKSGNQMATFRSHTRN